jgi:hypothetical protein
MHRLKRLVAGFPPRRPGSGQVGFVVDKVAPGQVFSEYFGFPSQSTFHQFLQHHNHPGQVQQAIQWLMCRVDPAWTPPPNMRIIRKYYAMKVYGGVEM